MFGRRPEKFHWHTRVWLPKYSVWYPCTSNSICRWWFKLRWWGLNKFCYKIDTKISNFILTFSKTNFFDQIFVSKLEHRLNFKVGASALLGPQRFENLGVPDEDFLKRRSYDEVKALCEATGDVDMCRFDETFYQAASLFPDGQKMVSMCFV